MYAKSVLVTGYFSYSSKNTWWTRVIPNFTVLPYLKLCRIAFPVFLKVEWKSIAVCRYITLNTTSVQEALAGTGSGNVNISALILYLSI